MSSTADALSQIGFDFIIKAVRVAVGGVCYGAYLLLITSSTTILLRQGWRKTGPMVLLGMTIFMFLGCTMFFIIDLLDIIYRFKAILIENPDDPLKVKSAHADEWLQRFVWTGEMLFIFLLIFGDSIVIWRTWIIYTCNRLPLIVPCLTWFGSIIAAFYELGCDAKFGWKLPDSGPSVSSAGIEICARADTASFSLSFATNIICTVLIMYRAWRYRQRMKKFLDAAGRKTQVEKLLVLLIESGAVYLVIYTFQAVPIYGGPLNRHATVAVQAVNAVIQQAMGMYPTAIVVLVQLQKTLWDTPETHVAQSSLQFTPCSAFSAASELEMGFVSGGSDGSYTATAQSKDAAAGQHEPRATIEIRRMSSSTSFVALSK